MAMTIKLSFQRTEKNVTLIHAENGVGKTTILNSILWCFYDKFTADFEKQEELVNLDATKEGITTCDVEVEFFMRVIPTVQVEHLIAP